MEDKMTDAQKEAPIRIDYDNVDVADIMNQIKRRIAQRPPVPAGAPAATGEGPSGVVPAALGGGEGPPGVVPAAPSGGEGLVMRAIRMLIRPFMPIVRPLLDRFIIRVNMDVNVRIDQMNDRFNTRIDEMSGRIDTVSGELNMRIDQVYGRIDQVSDRLNIRIDEVSDKLIMRIDKLSDGFNTARENTRLLHTLAHNLVFELTKLRIEYETLKSKMRIMEKDFEVLGKREKVLEKKVIE